MGERIVPNPAICRPCLNGRHPHDRYTVSGADGGCPNMTGGYPRSTVCSCTVKLPTTPPVKCHTCGQVRRA